MRTQLSRPLLAALAIGLTAPVAAPTATAAPAQDTVSTATRESKVILRAEPRWSGRGERVGFSGEVYDAASFKPLANRRIILQSKPTGTSDWSTLARLESNAYGSFQLSWTVDRSRTYRAVYPGNDWYERDSSAWMTQYARPGTHTKISARLTADGTGSRIKGRLTKKWDPSSVVPVPGVPITIERATAYSNYFQAVRTTTTNSHGYYTWRSTVAPSQCHRYRAVFTGTTTWAPKSTVASWSSCT